MRILALMAILAISALILGCGSNPDAKSDPGVSQQQQQRQQQPNPDDFRDDIRTDNTQPDGGFGTLKGAKDLREDLNQQKQQEKAMVDEANQ